RRTQCNAGSVATTISLYLQGNSLWRLMALTIKLCFQHTETFVRKRSISSIIVRSLAFRHRIGVEQIPENRECQMERKGIRLTGNLIWNRSPAKGSAPRLTPNVRVLPSPACIIGADV